VTRRTGAVAAAGGAIGLWSLNAAAGGAALEQLTVLQVLALQFAGAFAVLAGHRAKQRRAVAPVLAPRTMAIGSVGLAGTIGLQYLAFGLAPLLAANAIAYAWPLLVAAWIALTGGGRGARASLAFAAIGFAGVVLVFAARGEHGPAGSAPLVGYVAALGSALAMATYTVAVNRVRVPAGDLLLAGTGAGALLTAPAALIEGADWTPLWAAALALAIGAAMLAAGYGLWTLAMAAPGGARLAPAAYATPLLSTGLLIATGERLPALGLAGCGLIVVCALGAVAGALGRQPAPASSSSSRRCTSAAAIAPSPTAPPTRLVEPWRASPAAKKPGTLVSSTSGSRSSGQPAGRAPRSSRSGPVST
jgi:drug/metabolite transporter (DMT)-like permease